MIGPYRVTFRVCLLICLMTLIGGSTFAQEDPQPIGVLVPSACPVPVPVGAVVDCSYISVPQRHDVPDGPTFQLAVAIVRTDNPDKRPDPVIYLSGGPGGSALADLEGWIDLPINRERDVVLFDQRGTGYSLPGMFCENYKYDFDTDEDFGRYILTCRDEIDREGIDIGAFNSRESAWDVAYLVRALGLQKANLYGISYGTRLALTVMRDLPEVVRAVVLDSPYPPHVNGFEAQVTNGFSAMDALLTACAADTACNTAFPSLSERFYIFLESGRVVYANVGRGNEELTGYDISHYLFDVLYDSDAIPMIPMALSNILDGDAELFGDLVSGYYVTYEGEDESLSSFFDSVDAIAMRVLGMDNTDFLLAYLDRLDRNRRSLVYAQAISEASEEELHNVIQYYLDFASLEEAVAYYAALTAEEKDELIQNIVMALAFSFSNTTDSEVIFHTVNCIEEVPFNRVGQAEQNSLNVAAQVREALLDSVYFQFELCNYWNVPGAPEIETAVVQSDIPTLVLVGQFDPITPLVFADAAMDGLTHGTKVVVPGGGHSVIRAGDCPASLGISFLNAPETPLDTSCLASMQVKWETVQP